MREICDDIAVYSFSNETKRVPSRRGFALRDAINSSQAHQGTYLGQAVRDVEGKYDRLIVITDEQAHDSVPAPAGRGYLINVASYKNGVGYGKRTHIDGWSESIVAYIREVESTLNRSVLIGAPRLPHLADDVAPAPRRQCRGRLALDADFHVNQWNPSPTRRTISL